MGKIGTGTRFHLDIVHKGRASLVRLFASEALLVRREFGAYPYFPTYPNPSVIGSA